MSKPKVFVAKQIIYKAPLEVLHSKCDVVQWESDDVIPRQELLNKVKNMNGILCVHTEKIDAELLDAAGADLRVVSTISVGYEHINLGECKQRNILVGNTPDVLTDTTAELAVALLLCVTRNLAPSIKAVKDGEWGRSEPIWQWGRGLAGSTVGIFGLGRIGLAVAKRLQAFGVKQFLYNGRSKKDYDQDVGAIFVEFDELLEKSDFIIALSALTSETKGIFNKAAFDKMKPSAIFINSSRGGVVVQDDLYEALHSGEIAAAGLDVTTPEPLPTDHPLLQLPNRVILPHIGSATHETRSAMAMLAVQNIIAGLDGKPLPASL